MNSCKGTVDFVQNSLDLSRYSGVWYEMQRSKNNTFEKGQCNTAEYYTKEGGIRNIGTEYYISSKTNKKNESHCEVCDPNNNAHWKISFGMGIWADYRVIATDYDTFSVIYSKNDNWMSKWWDLEFVWILARKPLVVGSEERDLLLKKAWVAFK